MSGPHMAVPDQLLFGLIGYPVSHSLSPAVFNAAFKAGGLKARYDLYPVPPAGLEREVGRLLDLGIRGFNVTLPHKTAVLPLMQVVEDSARMTGAVNTVQVTPAGLVGHNTDMGGFSDSFGPLGVPDVSGAAALVLGAGGAARAVAAALGLMGVGKIVIANRFTRETDALIRDVAPGFPGVRFQSVSLDPAAVAEAAEDAVLCVQATSLGLGTRDPLPVDPAILPGDCYVYDLVYGIGETAFVRGARALGLEAADGKELLLRQAVRNYALWLGEEAPLEAMRTGMEEEIARGGSNGEGTPEAP